MRVVDITQSSQAKKAERSARNVRRLLFDGSFWGLTFIELGVFTLLHNFDLITWSATQVAPVALVVVGLTALGIWLASSRRPSANPSVTNQRRL